MSVSLVVGWLSYWLYKDWDIPRSGKLIVETGLVYGHIGFHQSWFVCISFNLLFYCCTECLTLDKYVLFGTLLIVVSLRVSFGDLWSCCMWMRLIDEKGCLRSIWFLKYGAMIGEWLLWVFEHGNINRLILLGYKSRWCFKSKTLNVLVLYLYIYLMWTHIYINIYTHIYIYIYIHIHMTQSLCFVGVSSLDTKKWNIWTKLQWEPGKIVNGRSWKEP